MQIVEAAGARSANGQPAPSTKIARQAAAAGLQHAPGARPTAERAAAPAPRRCRGARGRRVLGAGEQGRRPGGTRRGRRTARSVSITTRTGRGRRPRASSRGPPGAPCRADQTEGQGCTAVVCRLSHARRSMLLPEAVAIAVQRLPRRRPRGSHPRVEGGEEGRTARPARAGARPSAPPGSRSSPGRWRVVLAPHADGRIAPDGSSRAEAGGEFVTSSPQACQSAAQAGDHRTATKRQPSTGSSQV